MTGEASSERSQTWSGCGHARRRRRRRARADDLLSQLGLSGGGLYWDWDDGEGTDEGAGEDQRADAVRIQALEKTVETMGETIKTLAERVKVLERIVVDDEANIAREIDKLKDDGAAG